MLAVVKTPRIDVRIEGTVPPRLLRLLKTEYGPELKLVEDEDNTGVDFFETDFYRQMKKRMTPGAYVRIYRENHTMTQEHLGAKVGASKSFICDIEHDRRAISKEMAKKFSALFKISVERFI
jgi:DNA-binding XRE family transcriptional regulator